jgi:hypothetical protein
MYRSFFVLTASQSVSRPINGWELFMCILSVTLCLFFGVFVVTMSCEQCEALSTGIAGIDAMQGRGEDEQLSVFQGLRKYACNSASFSVRWFLPLSLPTEKTKES